MHSPLATLAVVFVWAALWFFVIRKTGFRGWKFWVLWAMAGFVYSTAITIILLALLPWPVASKKRP